MATRDLERDISRIYQSAGKDMAGVGKEWRKYFKEAAKELKGKEEELQKAKESGDKKEIARLERELREEKQKITTGNAEYRKIVSETTDKLAAANQAALTYTNDNLPSYYTEAFNEEMKVEAVNMGVAFDIADEATIRQRISEGDIQMPKKKISVPDDKRWNTKYINSQVTQGIVQGESMDKIADRIFPEIMAKSDTDGKTSQQMTELLNRNRKAAIRNARTLVNGVENKGRQDRYNDLERKGCVIKKIWIATEDDRTREWHADMDGQEVDNDEMFIDGNGNELEYPGDPNAEPETVYNCRCTMRAEIKEYNPENAVEEEAEEETTEAVETAEEEPQAEEAEETFEGVVEGRDLTGEWERRPDEYEHEINDVIAAQGFDGPPQFMSPEEFDQAVKEANGGEGFIAQRTYSAPDEETLEFYQEQLYGEHGRDWYVDCSTGGAQYGQGMYAAGNYNGELSEGITSEMEHYAEVSRRSTANAAWEEEIGNIDWKEETMRREYDYYGEPTDEETRVFMEYIKNGEDETKLSAEDRAIFEKSEGIMSAMGGAYDDAKAEFRNGYEAPHMTETMTLDPSAKIISYNDLKKEYKEDEAKLPSYDKCRKEATKEIVAGMDMTKEEKKEYIEWMDRYQKPSTEKNTARIDELEEKHGWDYKQYRATQDEVVDRTHEIYDESRKGMPKDLGSYAAMKGYDAIRAEGHGGDQKDDSYTVILNRTKLIIRKGA